MNKKADNNVVEHARYKRYLDKWIRHTTKFTVEYLVHLGKKDPRIGPSQPKSTYIEDLATENRFEPIFLKNRSLSGYKGPIPHSLHRRRWCKEFGYNLQCNDFAENVLLRPPHLQTMKRVVWTHKRYKNDRNTTENRVIDSDLQ